MRTDLIIAAAIIGAVSAVHQTRTQAVGNMDQTMSNRTYLIDNLDDVQAQMAAWYDSKAKPFIIEHREAVYQAALAEVELDKGELLETCDEGTKCRNDITKDMQTQIKRIWQTVLTNFNTNIENTIAETRTEVETNWQSLVQCQIDANCCAYQEVTIQNLWTQVTNYRKKIVDESNAWILQEERRTECVVKCPLISLSCNNVCFDGSARSADCSCNALASPPCPNSLCADGSARNAETCDCPQTILESVIVPADKRNLSIYAAPDWSKTEICGDSVTVTWGIPEHIGLLNSYRVMIGGHMINNCFEHGTVQLEKGRCTFKVQDLIDKPFSLDSQSEIVAKVQAVYSDDGVSDWSPIGSGAFIPLPSSFMSAHDWEKTVDTGYIQAPKNPSYTHPLTGLKDFGKSRFDFRFGCEISESWQGTLIDNMDNLDDVNNFPADGIRAVRVTFRPEGSSKIVRGMWFLGENDEVIYQLDADTYEDLKVKDSFEETTVTLNDGERIIGVRGETSNDFKGKLGYWRDLQFLVSDGVSDRVLTVDPAYATTVLLDEDISNWDDTRTK